MRCTVAFFSHQNQRSIMSKKLLLFLITIASTLSLNAQNSSALFGSLRARQIGPAAMSGRVSSIAVAPGKPEIIYVSAAGGGVWKSNSGGTTFRPIFDDHTMSIGKVVVDPNDTETVWVGTGEQWVRNSVSMGDGVYKSTNGGTRWEHMGLEDTERISDLIVHPENSNVVFVAALGHLWNANEERGLFKTADGGKTWRKILYVDEDTGCTDLTIDPENPDIMYAAMWSHRRLPWTFDSGFTGGSGLYKTTDGGENWTKVTGGGLPEGKLGRLAIEIAPSNRNVIYLTVECEDADQNGLYLSTDAGETWELVNNEFNTTVRPFYFANLKVDPQNDSIVMKSGLQAIISEDRGERFRPTDQTVHSDIHDIWFDPQNGRHILLATDGGVYESFDRGYTYRMFMNLPISQFYRVSVDNDIPYNVYGGLQDNGCWYAPSQKAGGITNSDWKSSLGGDGFWSFRHPTKEDVVFSESQGGNLARYSKKTGVAKNIRPYPDADEDEFRFNWNAPVHLSPNNPDRIYFASQYLFVSEDLGDSWQRISPDLTTNDPEKQKQEQSGGLTIDNSTAENHCTIYSIAESPQNEQIIWVGTDDGNLQVTNNGGESWTNVAVNVPDLPANTWVSMIEPGHFDANTAYVTFDGHRTGDKRTYVYKTTDLGKTWKNVATDQIEGYAFTVREDLVNPNLLFLGTEFGLWITVDGGENWERFTNNMPRVAVHDMVIHPRDHALVMGTHGRGVIILDDITPLRQYSDEVKDKTVHFFETQPTTLRDPGAGGGWFGGSADFIGPNPNTAAQIVYYMKKRHTFGKMYVEVWKDGALLKTLPAGKSAGINIVEMPTSMKKPKAAPTKNRIALFSTLFGPNLAPGTYDVKLIKGKDEFTTTFRLQNDPNSPYSESDRKVQRTYTMKLYDMTEQAAHLYHTYDQIETQVEAITDVKSKKLKTALAALAETAKARKDGMVALEGDGYVNEGEEIAERISDTYRQVSSYPGRPSQSQMDRADLLHEELQKLQAKFDALVANELAEINKQLEKADLSAITFDSFEDFKAQEITAGGSNNFKQLRKHLERSPLGRYWLTHFSRMF